MATLGYGYGSEFQLLRFLGRHRNELNRYVSNTLNIDPNIHWHDFKYSGFKDKELKGFEFIERDIHSDLNLDAFWPDQGPSWDAVGKTKETYVLIEAKAHLEELNKNDSCNATNKNSIELIKKRLDELQAKYEIPKNDSWFNKHYQLANRLAFTDYLNDKGIQTYLVYLLFLNGYECSYSGYPIKQLSVKSKQEWEISMDRMLQTMGIKGTYLESLIHTVFINCNSQGECIKK